MYFLNSKDMSVFCMREVTYKVLMTVSRAVCGLREFAVLLFTSFYLFLSIIFLYLDENCLIFL